MMMKPSFMSLSPIFLLIASFLFFFIKRRRVIPINWPIAGMLPVILANKHRLFDFIVCALRECGCTFMFKGPWFTGMDFIITCDPANANHVLNTNFPNYPKGDEFFEIFDILGEGIFNADGDEWKFQRRIGHALMTSREFRSSVAKHGRDKVANALLPLLQKVGESDEVIDANDLFMRFTFDVICMLVMGVDPASLAPDFPTMPFAEAVHDAEQVLFFRHVVPKFWWKLLRRLGLGEEKKLAAAVEVVDQFIGQCIEKRKVEMIQLQKNCKERSRCFEGILTSYMENVEVCSRPRPDKFLRDTVLTFLAAGNETTGTALSWLLSQISKNPDVEQKILEELSRIADHSSKENLNSDNMLVFDAEEIDKLVYLHATVCESLRLFPSIPFNHKVALKADVLPSGHRVRAGMKVIFSTYSMARMERIWGEDCMEFKPERWISEDGKLKREPSYKFLAFHCGPRLCLGKDMAFTQLKVVVAALVYNFHVQLVEGHDVEPKLAIVLQMKNGLMVKLRKRRAHQN